MRAPGRPHIDPQVPVSEPRRVIGYGSGLPSWIGYLEWTRDNGFIPPTTSVLERAEAIRCTGAIPDAPDPSGPRVEPRPPAAGSDRAARAGVQRKPTFAQDSVEDAADAARRLRGVECWSVVTPLRGGGPRVQPPAAPGRPGAVTRSGPAGRPGADLPGWRPAWNKLACKRRPPQAELTVEERLANRGPLHGVQARQPARRAFEPREYPGLKPTRHRFHAFGLRQDQVDVCRMRKIKPGFAWRSFWACIGDSSLSMPTRPPHQ
jgi:hypothetical protein